MSKKEKKELLKDEWPSYPHGEKKFIESVKKAAKLGLFEVDHLNLSTTHS